MEKRQPKKFEAGVANLNIQHNNGTNNKDTQQIKVAVGLIQCAFLQHFGKELNPNHIYLDMCATFSQVVWDKFLKDTQHTKTGLLAHCNAGTTFMDRFGYLGKLKVWHNAMGLANILSFHELEQHYDISYGTKSTSGNFIVTKIRRHYLLPKGDGTPIH